MGEAVSDCFRGYSGLKGEEDNCEKEEEKEKSSVDEDEGEKKEKEKEGEKEGRRLTSGNNLPKPSSEYDFSFKVAVVGTSQSGKTSVLNRFENNSFYRCKVNLKPTKKISFATKSLLLNYQKKPYRVNLQIFDSPSILYDDLMDNNDKTKEEEEDFSELSDYSSEESDYTKSDAVECKEMLFEGVQGILFVYDMSSDRSLEGMKRIYTHLKNDVYSKKEFQSIEKLVVSSKMDCALRKGESSDDVLIDDNSPMTDFYVLDDQPKRFEDKDKQVDVNELKTHSKNEVDGIKFASQNGCKFLSCSSRTGENVNACFYQISTSMLRRWKRYFRKRNKKGSKKKNKKNSRRRRLDPVKSSLVKSVEP